MNRVVTLGVTARLLAQEPTYLQVAIVVGSIVVTAYALPLRIIWCRVQPLLIFGLFVLGAWLRRRRLSQSVPLSYSRARLTTYERLVADDGANATHWDEALFVYAAWIAYGAVFHEARHAAADLALFDDTWITSAQLVSTLRALSFTLATCYSYSQAFIQRPPSFWLAFGAYGAFLFVLPPLHGVPHALAVYETLARAFAFLWLFAVNEFMRNLIEHWHFAARVRLDALDPTTLVRVEDASAYMERPDGDELPLLALSATTARNAKPLPGVVENVRLNQQALPVSWSVMRTAWILTLPSGLLTYACLAVCIACAYRYTGTWSHSAVYMINVNAKRSDRVSQTRAVAGTTASPRAAAPASLSAIERGESNGHVSPAANGVAPRACSPLSATEIALNESIAMLRAQKMAAMRATQQNPLAHNVGNLVAPLAMNGTTPLPPIGGLLNSQAHLSKSQRAKIAFDRRVALARQQEKEERAERQKLQRAKELLSSTTTTTTAQRRASSPISQ